MVSQRYKKKTQLFWIYQMKDQFILPNLLLTFSRMPILIAAL